MSIEQTTAPAPGTVNLSTTLDPNVVNLESGGGKPNLTEPATGDDSLESVLSGELSRLRAEDAKAEPEAEADEPDAEGEEKPEKDAKADKEEKKDAKEAKTDDKAKDEKAARQRSDDGKFAKAEKAEGDKAAPEGAQAEQVASERRPSEGRTHAEPPARFLPKEREAWGNVPNVVKSAISRLSTEHETEVSQYRASHEEWTKLDKFHSMAKQHNTNIGEALDRYTKLDGLLASNPIEGIRQVLATRGITPEQYADHVMKNPGAHRPQAAPPQPDPAVQQMGSQVAELKAELESMRLNQAASSIIEPFRAKPENSRYDELQDDIALFLQSGKIPASLSPQEKLEAAYDMAVRINPTSTVAPLQANEAPAAKEETSPAKLAAGKKSIRGAPSNGADTATEDDSADNLDELLRKEMRKIAR